MSQEKITERVRKLLALAADTSSPAEAAIAARRAAALMEQHNLSHADVMLREGIGDRIAQETASRDYGAVPRWYNILTVPVAHLYDCEVRFAHRGGRRYAAEFVGLDDDALVASYVLDYLANEIERLARRHREQYPTDRRRMNDFRLGASHEIIRMLQRMEAEKRQRETSGASAARDLVVLKRELIRQHHDIRYRTVETEHRISRDYQAGRVAGAGVRLRHGVDAPDGGRLD
jgi:hypothetical protein